MEATANQTHVHVEVYDQNPEGYDQFQGFFLNQFEEAAQLYQDTFNAFEVRGGHDLLEVGMGTGLNLRFFPADANLHGLDRSAPMLEFARRRLAALGRTARLEVGDAGAMPYADASFDRVACIFVLCTADDPRALLREMARICRPGGRVALIDYHRSNNPDILVDQQFMLETMQRGIFFGGKEAIVCNALHDLNAALPEQDFEIVHDGWLEKSFCRSFRGTVLQRK